MWSRSYRPPSRAEAVSETVERLIFVLVLTGLGALVLAAAGGLFMSRRAMRPVQEAFGRQTDVYR